MSWSRRLSAAALAVGLGCGSVFVGPVRTAHALPEQFLPTRCLPGTAQPMGDPWQVRRLGLADAHTLATGEGVKIAMLDTGVDTVDNPALSQQLITNYNITDYSKAVTQEGQPGPSRVDCTQGSALATLIGGQGQGFTAVAPNARILAIRTNQLSVDDPESPEPVANLVAGVDAARELGADVLLVPRPASADPSYVAAIQAALADDIVIVAAAGDQTAPSDQQPTPAPPPGYPASEPGVISVGATTVADLPAANSAPLATGKPVTIGAPGENVMTAFAGDADGAASWAPVSGTAYAAAQVAGIAGLLKQREPSLTSAQVAERLIRTADVPGITTPALQIGAGVVNPVRALSERPAATTEANSPQPPPPLDPRDRPDPHRQTRFVAIVIGAGVVIVVTVVAGIAAAVPGGRRRRWRGGE